ncbi:cytochrome C assembly protein [Staphylococcus schleiferi subsp. coagulans]|uniref:cytochrome c biogenesis protein CcsA n=1 Tax=Staphylococcus coagulans TaxID=74706 RepID=UPI0015FB0887|nr:cytochrome c biogenesis protein CcsA [Staphylococcus coagulans]MBA8758827.1 cytochrome C assembly protein [Staphylococcus coagulans]MBA8768394.1 cytochrome C assembly protein [Staphylococcus coagulans]
MEEAFFIRFHEIILLIYLVSMVCLIIDVFQKNYRVQNIGFYALGIVWFCQTVSLTMFITWQKQLPLTSLVESFYVLTWLILTITFIMSVMRQSDFMIVFLNVIGFIFMTIHTFHPQQFKMGGTRLTVMNELLVFHISLALLSYVIFAVAFVNAIIYLIQYRNLKQKRFNQNYFRISSIGTLEKIVFYSSLVGTIIMFISLLLGILRGMNSIGFHIFADLKVISSLIIFVAYSIFIALRLTHRFKQYFLIQLNIMLFLGCMFNLIVVTQLSTFHQWTGV